MDTLQKELTCTEITLASKLSFYGMLATVTRESFFFFDHRDAGEPLLSFSTSVTVRCRLLCVADERLDVAAAATPATAVATPAAAATGSCDVSTLLAAPENRCRETAPPRYRLRGAMTSCSSSSMRSAPARTRFDQRRSSTLIGQSVGQARRRLGSPKKRQRRPGSYLVRCPIRN